MEKRVATNDRRTQTLRSIVYGGIYPRRVDNRRPADDQHFIVDWHDSGLFMVAMAIICMSCMDALFTLNLLSLGAEEVNYFMQVLIESDLISFLSVKFLTTSGGVCFWSHAPDISLPEYSGFGGFLKFYAQFTSA